MKKIILCAITYLMTTLALPLVLFRTADGWDALFYVLLFFFVIYPVQSVFFGILTATDWKKLWCIPVFAAILFPPLFWITLSDVVWVLYLYAALYLGLSALTTFTVALVRHVIALKRAQKNA